jgi:hypothetical protein
MSHFTSIKTRIVSLELLLAALKDLAIEFQTGELEIRGYQGKRTAVHVSIATANPDYQIGFRRVGDHFELVADWYGISEVKQEEFLCRVMQRYAYLAAREQLERQGFSVVEEEVGADRTIHLTVRRMV